MLSYVVIFGFLLVSLSVNAVNVIGISGNKFYDTVTGKRFFVNGIAYQPTVNDQFEDVITNENRDGWKQDLARMRELGINVIRVYETDPDKDHDEFMKATADANIYVLIDLPSSKTSINRKNPSYSLEYLQYLQKKIDAFAGYNNVLGFLAGNEVANDDKTTPAAAYVKAVVRDVKAYIKRHASRQVPVGYASVDDDKLRMAEALFFTCGPPEAQVDFYAINIYSWCGDKANFVTSGYADRVKDFSSFAKPIFFSEYGCNEVRPRNFNEVGAMFDSSMTKVFSGGIMYEYSQERNNYGIVEISSETRSQLDEFDRLKEALQKVNPPSETVQDGQPSESSSCPATTQVWKANVKLPPTPSKSSCDCMLSSLNCRLKNSDMKNASELLSVTCGMVQEHGGSCDDMIGSTMVNDEYPPYGFCPTDAKVSWAFNEYTKRTGRTRSQCDFEGKAQWVQNPLRDSDAECRVMVDETVRLRNGWCMFGVLLFALFF